MLGSSNALLCNASGSAISGNECPGLPGNVTSSGLDVARRSISPVCRVGCHDFLVSTESSPGRGYRGVSRGDGATRVTGQMTFDGYRTDPGFRLRPSG